MSDDSALQKIAWDLADEGYSNEEVQEILSAVEEELRVGELYKRAFRMAIMSGSQTAAEDTAGQLLSRIHLENLDLEMDEDEWDLVYGYISDRFLEKEAKLVDAFEGAINVGEGHANNMATKQITGDWEPVGYPEDMDAEETPGTDSMTSGPTSEETAD